MPIIKRIETDMFVFSDVVDYMVNPVNLIGVPGAGLALEFRRRAPEYVDIYREACKTEELRVGTLKIIETSHNWDMICFPTKRHYADTTNKEDLLRGLESLQEILSTDKYRYASIGMPMLGCGLGEKDYETVYPMMMDYLHNWDATIFLSMSPTRTEMRPKYLVLAGPPGFGKTEEEQNRIEETIDKVMLSWGTTLSDYEDIISGGNTDFDKYVCGENYRKLYEDTFVFKKTNKIPLVVKQNKLRNGLGANLNQNNLLCEAAHDIILFKPPGFNNNRLTQMQLWLEADKPKRINDGHPPRRVAVFGEHKPVIIEEKVIMRNFGE